MDSFLASDLNYVVSDSNIPWEKFSQSTVLVTGASGLIGSLVCKSLLNVAQVHGMELRVVGIVRNMKRALEVFSEYSQCINRTLILISQDVCKPFDISMPITHIIHTASPTSSQYFVEHPVETISSIVLGTKNILSLASAKHCSSILYLSSMEVYGRLPNITAKEQDLGYLDILSPRSSYPQGKRIAETLCSAYFHEYSVPVKIARLTQTFGPGVAYNDDRVFAQFARAVTEQRDIILLTKGATERDYIYTADAVRGIFTILLKGKSCEVYNVSNPNTYCSILQFAHVFAQCEETTSVRLSDVINQQAKYLDTIKISLDCEKIVALGFKNLKNLNYIVKTTIDSFKSASGR